MELPGLAEEAIRERASAESFWRGQDYCHQGAVLSLARRGNTLEAEVAGSAPEAYAVRVDFDEAGVVDATCSCPYDWGGWCKHIVAVLLACLSEPERVEQRPSLEDLLAGLDREQLQGLLLELAEQQPRLSNAIEARVSVLKAASPAAPAPMPEARAQPARAPVDPQPFRRQVSALLHSLDRMSGSEAYYQVGGVVEGVRGLLRQARDLIEADDGRNALMVLEAITQEYLAGWESLDDSDGDASAFFEDLGIAWAEALLSADLTPPERRAWATKLEAWQAEIDQYGVDQGFGPAMEAARQGWDDPRLQRILRGEPLEPEQRATEALEYADELAEARLNILERRGRYQEHLSLARAEGQTERYVTMLVRLGRAAEAVEYGLRHLATAAQALSLARALQEQGNSERALQVAQHGLSLEGRKAELAAWLRDLAAGMGKREQALAAARVAFGEEQSLASYVKVQELAGEQWTALRPELLELLRQTKGYYPQGPVEVFLHEGLIEDAIAAVAGGATHTLVERVVDAAIASHPDWAIQTSRAQAEPIMNGGKAQHYGAAVDWLRKARSAYLAGGREKEWQSYLAGLVERHGRKYKLVPMLKALK
ncbi:MAG: SWIM zinc finger domain-containing protein [Chloroflexi bacterium]|nr:SWIM zinc finger domain-containing protein [Chloroflexota bacterium]